MDWNMDLILTFRQFKINDFFAGRYIGRKKLLFKLVYYSVS